MRPTTFSDYTLRVLSYLALDQTELATIQVIASADRRMPGGGGERLLHRAGLMGNRRALNDVLMRTKSSSAASPTDIHTFGQTRMNL